jgi:hypothetical protein
MNIVSWKDANDEVAGGATTRREREVKEDQEETEVRATSVFLDFSGEILQNQKIPSPE